jgi:polar amino acid transport system substrate-binding protein
LTARLAALAVTAVLVAGACSPASPSPTTTTTTTTVIGADGTVTTTTQLTISGEGFQTRLPGVVVVGTERPVPPWYTSAGGEITGGLEYRVAREIGSRLGVPNITVVRSSLVRMMTGQDCGCDIILSGVSVTDGRARSLDLTEPYLDADQALLVRQGTTVAGVAAAAQLRLGVAVHNAVGLDVIHNRIKPTIEPVVVVNEDDALRELADGRLDGVLLDVPDALVRANGDASFVVAGQIHTGEQYAVALSLGSSNTALVNEVIRDMRSDGTLDAIVRTFLGVRPADVPALE